jgi:site-specific DNA recombinase
MAASSVKLVRCAIYTRKSTEHGLELEFNSLDAQRDACEAYIKSQASQGWMALSQHYDDPAYSGGNLDRPALQQLLKDIDAGRIDVIVVYKIDRLTRSLADFAKLVEAFNAKSISFVAVTQQYDIDGPFDPQRPLVLCPVRARAVLRTGSRQGGGLKA